MVVTISPSSHDGDMTATLNRYSEEGWSLVSVVFDTLIGETGRQTSCYRVFMQKVLDK